MKKKIGLFANLDPDIAERVEGAFDVVFRRTSETDKACLDENYLKKTIAGVAPEAVVIEAIPFTRSVLQAAPSLRLIASVRTTPSNVDAVAARELGIAISNAPGRNALAVAEFAIALVFSCARMIPQAYRALRQGEYLLPAGTKARSDPNDVVWSNPALPRRPYVDFKGKEISGAVLGIVGFGGIGRMVAERAKALGMRVLASDPFVPAADIAAAGYEAASFAGLLAESDFVSLHAKVTPDTQGMIDAAALARMKSTAYLVNTARGALVKQADLLEALKARRIAGAAIDVFENEPLSADDELLRLDNLILTPHIGGATYDVIKHQSRSVWRNLEAYLRGEEAPDRWGR